MSKAQGDGFRTWTDKGLNDYKTRLDAKLAQMAEATEKWYDNGDGFLVCAKSRNILENPNGSWKWNGWRVAGREYMVSVFDESDVTFNDGEADVHGIAIAHRVFTDREKALDFFKACRA